MKITGIKVEIAVSNYFEIINIQPGYCVLFSGKLVDCLKVTGFKVEEDNNSYFSKLLRTPYIERSLNFSNFNAFKFWGKYKGDKLYKDTNMHVLAQYCFS